MGSLERFILLYVFFLPLEDFFLQDIAGSITRILASVFVVMFFLTGRPLVIRQLSISYYAFFALAIMSIIFWAEIPDYYAIFRLFIWLLTTIVIGSCIVRRPCLLVYIPKAYLMGSLVLVVISLIEFRGIAGRVERVEVLGLDQNLLAMHVACGIVVLTFLLKTMKNTIFKLLSGILLFCSLLAMFSTGSRSGVIAIVLVFIYFFRDTFKTKRAFATGFLVSFCLVLPLIFDNIFFHLILDRFSQAVDAKTHGRLVIWKIAVNVIQENPIFGVGYRSFPEIVKSYYSTSNLSLEEFAWIGTKTRMGTHNAFFEVFTALGAVGVTLFYRLQYLGARRISGEFKEIRNLYMGFYIALVTMSIFLDMTNLKVFWLILGSMQTIQYLNKLET